MPLQYSSLAHRGDGEEFAVDEGDRTYAHSLPEPDRAAAAAAAAAIEAFQ